jgi:uncharacterized protein (DUF302 family)
MPGYTLTTSVDRPYDETVETIRAALGAQGFGILTEIDLQATLKAKLGVDTPRQAIFGACRPALAYQALQAEPSIAALLPCNVVVRAVDEGTTQVEVLDPDTMAELAGNEQDVRTMAREAKKRLTAALAAVTEEYTVTEEHR